MGILTIVLAGGLLTGPGLMNLQAPPPPEEESAFGDSPDAKPIAGWDKPRIRCGLFATLGSINGRIEKEQSGAGIGSGGDKISLRSDMDLPLYSWMGGTEVVLETRPHFRIRLAAQSGRWEGSNILGEGFRHDGHVYPAGDSLESKFELVMGDAEFHLLPRQAERTRGEFGLFVGVRAYQTRSILEGQVGGRVNERTTGVIPRFGVQGFGDIGSRMQIYASGAIGGWANGSNNNNYYAADFEGHVGLAYIIRFVDIRVGYRYHQMGIWRERSADIERVTIERSAIFLSAAVWF